MTKKEKFEIEEKKRIMLQIKYIFQSQQHTIKTMAGLLLLNPIRVVDLVSIKTERFTLTQLRELHSRLIEK
ncbi:hypothetical protein MA785_000806 [Vibrio parahaemolyticus]|nr:hypothetical protein [Vibrio parahaemolyticus]EJR2787915.1 hypothetical protein [Vibrio parahaemolyticus]